MIVADDLPDLLDLDRFESSERASLHAYGVFSAQVVIPSWVVRGRDVYVPDGGKCMEPHSAFWHICTEDHGALGRQRSIHRMRHVTWIPVLLAAAGSGEIYEWQDERQTSRGPEMNWNLAPSDFKYLIVLRENDFKGVMQWRLLTAFPLEKQYRRDQKRNAYGKAFVKYPG